MKNFIESVKQEKGNFAVASLVEGIIFFCASFGFSDFILNTLFFKKTKLVDDAIIPGTLVTTYMIPGYFIAITYLTGKIDFDWLTLALCVIVNAAGGLIGSRLALKYDAAKIKKIIGYAMIFSMIALIIKLIVSSQSSGMASGLSPLQLVIALPIVFVISVLNMMGVPLKPPVMSMFLLMGMSPLATLTIIMTMCMVGPTIGGINYIKSGKYQKKIFLSGAIFGSLGTVLGGIFALNINPMILTVAMLVAMAVVSYSMLKK